MFLFTREKYDNDIADHVKVYLDNIKVLDTFVNYRPNLYEDNNNKNYWFSCLTYKQFNVKHLNLSFRPDYYIIDYEFCKSVNYLNIVLKNINDYIKNNMKTLCELIESNVPYAYFEKLED